MTSSRKILLMSLAGPARLASSVIIYFFMAKPLIKIEKLNVVYNLGKSNEVPALKDINLEIYPNEFVVFFGPSGCGKSTLLYAIAGLETNVTGKIVFQDKDITKLSREELELIHQRKIGMIFQAYYLINSLNVLNNVALPLVFMEEEDATGREKAEELLKRFGVINQADKLPAELSGGQQQRVAIARALVNNPEIILADEPVGNLDSKSSTEVMNLLKELNQKNNKTVILVTHNVDHLKLADRIFYMKDGYIVDTKVKTSVSEINAKTTEAERDVQGIPKELELIIRTYSSLSPTQLGTMLIPFKAKQIISEVLTNMSVEEVAKIENQAQSLLMRGLENSHVTLEFLDGQVARGGLGLNKKTAEAIVNKIKNIIKEIKTLEAIEAKKKTAGYKTDGIDSETVQARKYLFDLYDVNIKSFKKLEIIDKAIDDRLKNKIDIQGFRERLDKPSAKAGAGLDKRLVRKLSRRLELLILGKYN